MSDETREIDRTLDDWARIRLEELAAEAGEVAALLFPVVGPLLWIACAGRG